MPTTNSFACAVVPVAPELTAVLLAPVWACWSNAPVFTRPGTSYTQTAAYTPVVENVMPTDVCPPVQLKSSQTELYGANVWLLTRLMKLPAAPPSVMPVSDAVPPVFQYATQTISVLPAVVAGIVTVPDVTFVRMPWLILTGYGPVMAETVICSRSMTMSNGNVVSPVCAHRGPVVVVT